MNRRVIGLTGPTGAGKSTVAAAFAAHGCKIIDADQLARSAVEITECVNALKKEFGADIVETGGVLNRQLLAKRAFANPQKAARLNEITHPIILREVLAQIEQAAENQTVVLDAPLLFESGADRFCAKTVAVTAPVEVRLSRVVQRDSIPVELARARIAAQHEESYYTQRADYVVDGSAPISTVTTAAEKLLKQICGELHEKIQNENQ